MSISEAEELKWERALQVIGDQIGALDSRLGELHLLFLFLINDSVM